MSKKIMSTNEKNNRVIPTIMGGQETLAKFSKPTTTHFQSLSMNFWGEGRFSDELILDFYI
jgi:phosphoribosyl-AMP cyclohydrolase